MSWPTALTTERLVLRPWRPDDAEALFAVASDPDVGPAAGWAPHASLEESREVLEHILMVPETYAITLRDSPTPDEPVGAISLKIGETSDLAIGDDQAELGYWLGKPLWGHGLMPEAVREVMRHAFCDLGLVAIWAGHYADNDRSRRVQEKVGLHHQRTIRNRPRRAVGDYVTEDVNWITREEWEVLQAADPTDAVTVQAQQDEADGISSRMAASRAYAREARPAPTAGRSTQRARRASPSAAGARPGASPRTDRSLRDFSPTTRSLWRASPRATSSAPPGTSATPTPPSSWRRQASSPEAEPR